ncbi:MAG: hypothetical protein WCD76_09970 [Pyrinomonadaceae bacterium]
MPTETPPPYFPQDSLSPGDESRYRKLKLAFFGCLALLLLALGCVIFAAIRYFSVR